jgi:hypothetical protein
MARKASENVNSPDDVDVQAAVKNIEERYQDLASERGTYMLKCRRIREGMANDYEAAGNRGISKKLLKKIIKERDYERKIDALTADLEPDERSELEMLVEKLGAFADTPLGQAAVAKAEGGATLKAVGA